MKRLPPAVVLSAMLVTSACRSHAAPASTATRVLFVGNSYTGVNDLPMIVRRLGEAMNVPFDVEAVIPGGSTMAMHLSDGGLLKKIQEEHFRFVVLQGQSNEPLTQPREFTTASVKLAALVTASGATPVFYETWARKKGSADYDAAWTGKSADEMQSRLRNAYRKVATDSNAKLAPVGDARERAEVRDPSLVYYAADGSHPSMATTFLAACTLFEVFTDRSAVGAPGPAPLTPEQVATLEQVAHDTLASAAP